MSFHLTNVCDRCGARDMSPAITPEAAVEHASMLVLLVAADTQRTKEGNARCSACDPSVPDGPASQRGRLRAIWDGKAGS